MEQLAHLLVGVFATWRLTHLLFTEGGPFHMFDHFRSLVGVWKDEDGNPQAKESNQIGQMVSCFWCLSIWCAGFVSLLNGGFNIPNILAWSAGALFLGFLQCLIDPDERRMKLRHDNHHPHDIDTLIVRN